MGQLNNALRSLAIQASGTDPIVGRLVATIAGFAIGGVLMTAVLAGVAALGLAYRRLTADARAAAAESERLRGVSADLVARSGPGDLPGARALAQYDLDQAQNRLRALRERRAELQRMGFRTPQYDEWIAEAAWESSQFRLARDRMVGETATVLPELVVSVPGRRRAAEMAWANEEGARRRAASLEATGNTLYQRGWFEGRGMGTGQPMSLDAMTDRFGDRLAQRQRELEGAARARANAEEELARRREQANQALVVSLMNVGRAYGGVTDQVMSLAAATMSLSRMAGFGRGETPSTGDMVRGYGSAALTGIGYGVSTGNAGLGFAGGFASGAVMAGPAGAIIGGVSGIVSGLLEQGRRAQEAARIWRMAMEDYALLFDELTPEQQYTQQNRRMFMQQSGGLTPEQIGAILGTDVPDFALQNVYGMTRAQMEELVRIYAENAKQAGELAKKERELHDARFSALNAPTGFNAAYYGWMAGGSFVPPPPGTGGGTTVHVYIDGEEVAARLEHRQRRRYVMGGGEVPTAR